MALVQIKVPDDKKIRLHKKSLDEGKTLTQKINELIDKELKRNKK